MFATLRNDDVFTPDGRIGGARELIAPVPPKQWREPCRLRARTAGVFLGVGTIRIARAWALAVRPPDRDDVLHLRPGRPRSPKSPPSPGGGGESRSAFSSGLENGRSRRACVRSCAAPAWFGRERDLVTDPRDAAPVRIGGPTFRELELPVDQRVPGCAGVREEHSDLTMLDPTRGPEYWHCTPAEWVPFVKTPCRRRSTPRRFAESFDHIIADIGDSACVVPRSTARTALVGNVPPR